MTTLSTVRYAWLTLVVIILFAMVAASNFNKILPSGSISPCPQCNVVIISLQSIRPDHMSLYGYTRPTTPYLSEHKNDWRVFDSFYAKVILPPSVK